jgi:PAS domain S-box-containing protein
MPLSADEFRAFTSLIAEKTTDGILCADSGGKVWHANESAARLLHYEPHALIEKDIYALAPEMLPALWKELWKEIRSSGAFAFEFQLRGKGGQDVQVEIAAHRLPLATRELACLVFRDVEERKRLQNLQQEFVSNVSHELRTPMTVIREGISQVLEGLRGDINDAQNRALSLAMSGIERMGRIINDLLDISKIESGKVPLKRERLDLSTIAREVAGSFQGMAEARGLDLRVTTPAGTLMVYADRDRMTQVLTNLVGNSLKFTEKGHIQIELFTRNGEVECAVRDTGIGIMPDDLEKIFAKFEQAGSVAFTGEKGTGLGLSISRGILELHKGRIWAESRGRGQGSEMRFALPRQSGQDVFRDGLAPVLHAVARRSGTLSTISFRFAPQDKNEVDLTRLAPLLDTLEQSIRRERDRMKDLLVVDVDAIYVALESTVKKEAARLAELVCTGARQELASALLTLGLALHYEIKTFPEEHGDEKMYLTHLFTERH